MRKLLAVFLILSLILMPKSMMVGRAETVPNQKLDFTLLSDPILQQYISDEAYQSIIEKLDSESYFVENVSVVYISQEYLDEMAYNSQSNIYFGYTLQDLDEYFQGERYVFTLDDNNQTVVRPFEKFEDKDIEGQIIRNIAIGAGIILICVTVSLLTGGTGTAATASVAGKAIHMIFSVAATTAKADAVLGFTIGALSSGIVKGIETKNVYEALKAAAVGGSEGFKWGAIVGSTRGAAIETLGLWGATLNGLTMNQAATIQKATKWPLKAIRSIHSLDEYNIYRAAGLTPIKFGGEWAFKREINWDLVDKHGLTNAQRVAKALAPIDDTGMSYELHHMGQRADSPLAILSYAEHRSNSKILNYAEEGKNVSDNVWRKQRIEFWKNLLTYDKGVIVGD